MSLPIPPSEASANSARYQNALAERQFQILQTHPHLQAEKIADHYTKLATTARVLAQMVRLKARSDLPTPDIDCSIKYITDQIAEHHLTDFGIPLAWPDTTPTQTTPR